ncbi:MAG: hypothetical protein JXX28_14905 [Deltaproteobacteria bacterium]|nr:hypothetical protein [Deltaproteobacteria bacterium]
MTMKLQVMYTPLLIRLPAWAGGLAVGVVSFLGASLSGVGMMRVRGGGVALEMGLSWGVLVAMALTFLVGAPGLLLLRRSGWRSSLALALIWQGAAQTLALLGGTWLGAVLGGDLLPAHAGLALWAHGAAVWPVPALAAFFAAVAWISSATGSTPP